MGKSEVSECCKRQWEIPRRPAPKERKGRKMAGHSPWVEKLKNKILFLSDIPHKLAVFTV